MSQQSFFTSDREKRLWFFTLTIVVAIYSTLGLARTLAGILRDNGLLEASFLLGMLLVGAAVVVQGLKIRPNRVEIGVALGIAAVYLLVFTRMATPEERTHLIEYSVLAIFIYEALLERVRNSRQVPAPALLAFLATLLIGLLDECIQAFLPNRVFDIRDICFNALAALMAITASLVLTRARRWITKPD